MKRLPSADTLFVVALALTAASCSSEVTAAATRSSAAKASADKDANNGHTTYAVIGDFPYGPVKRAELPRLVDLINADPTIERVIHLGDIKAGSSSDCSDAYFLDIRQQFDRFVEPLVYTPGDNEWVDCHVASKNNGLYTPTERLIKVREDFFPVVGRTLGVRSAEVTSQAEVDPANAQYIENVMWTHADVVFATVNIQGSDDDTAPWGTPLPADASSYPSQTQERVTRTQADVAWINRAFDRAKQAKAIVIAMQADMWDPASALDAFNDYVQLIGNLAIQFGKPVLILNGDSHVFHVDHPYTPGSPFFGLHANTPLAPNVTRMVVNGSAARTEYVRMTINPEAKNPNDFFTFVEVPLPPL